MTQPWQDAWGQVDTSEEPNYFVRFLDVTKAGWVRGASANPRAFFSFLKVQPQHQILDIGCGTGDAVRPLATLLQAGGRLVGLDYSETMIAEAQRRTMGSGLPVEYHVGDAHDLQFGTACFDRCFAFSVLMHLDCPRTALKELVRVTRPGGWIAALEVDLETAVIDATNRQVTRKMIQFVADGVRNGWIARQLLGLFHELGLKNVTTVPLVSRFPRAEDYALFEQWWWRPAVARAVQAGVIGAEVGEAWLDDLRQRVDDGRFFATNTAFRVMGRKPYL